MAFSETKFKKTYSPGDLFYGLDGSACNWARTSLMKQLCPNGIPYLAKINNYAVTANEVSSKAILQAKENEFRNELSRHGKYRTSLDWGPADGTVRTWMRNKNPALARNYTPSSDEKNAFEAEQNSAWRRKCKGGLYYACFVAKVYVHFCLEGFDFNMVINKSAFGYGDSNPTNPYKMRAVTNAELRWIHRYREFDEVREYIQFWKKERGNFVPCLPPWVWPVGGGNWTSYESKNVPNVLQRSKRLMEEAFQKLLTANENLCEYLEWLER